jgi:hypothetical protein
LFCFFFETCKRGFQLQNVDLQPGLMHTYPLQYTCIRVD